MKKAGVVAFAFGAPETIWSNRRIAEIASKKARELNALLFTQADIPIGLGVLAKRVMPQFLNMPPSTLRIAREAVQSAKQDGLTELWVVAAKPHLWRALRDIQRSIHEEGAQIEVRVCEEIERYQKDCWFCPDSIQNRTRSPKVWAMRECILNLIPFFLYKLMAS